MGRKYKVLDLFAGAGGLSNGFEQTGKFSVIGAVEINEAAQQTYIKNHENKDVIIKSSTTGISDITKIDFKNYSRDSENTVIIGGPPCQGFSNANRQKNYLISGNNKLVKEYVRAVRDVKPIAFLMENVKSINSSVHKFFVTEYKADNQNDFSSRHHLNQITQEDNKLYNKDTIELLSTDSESLKMLSGKYKSLIDVPAPLIIKPLLITRLRLLEKALDNNKELKLTKKSTDEILEIINQLNNQNITDENQQYIVQESIKALKNLLDNESLNNFNHQAIKDLVNLNRFLTRCQELKDEDIECLEFIVENKTIYKLFVQVYSYNVVKYLEAIFKFYGYSITSGVLDASRFGVPQKRNRFMMLGILNSSNTIELPEGDDEIHNVVRDAIEDLENILPQTKIDSYNSKVYVSSSKEDLNKYYREGMEPNEIYDHINTESSKLILERYKNILKNGGKNFHSLPDDLKSTYADASRTQNTVYLRLNYDEPSPTVINVRKSMWQHPTKARAISIREAARLQSFQDKFVFEGRKDERYQQIGNAVPPLLAKAIAEKILEYLI
ncbi:DNA cytosine methyltransferase [Exiguobacterium acetylicum]|uniref:DNA (cytosine-5-)-methyltransferase n=1 Tax=Exiguobacterium acetylicum TaxID=41170 RepID=A0ABX8GA05_EXIAC|nr:DNA cytosine methyltransferase [Exiguobacterium acetylicum]QWB30445.1 DNA cytosine methyltransferase [Exiguobacterium acetylicum]